MMVVKKEMTDEMQKAYNYIKNEEGPKIVWCTGEAGTGKSEFLRKLSNDLEFPNIVCLAPTGIAA